MVYKVVSAPKVVETSGGGAGASKVFEDIINNEAKQGWEFVSMETITSMEKQGCFKPPLATSHNMLIFGKKD